MISKKLNIFYSSAFFALSFLILTGCNNGGKQSSEAVVDTVDSIVVGNDTIVAEEQETKYAGPDLKGTAKQLAFMQKCGAWDRYKTGILPQMAEEEPEYCEKLLNSEYPYFIIVDKNKMKLFLYDKYGNIVKSYGIACARNFGHKHKKGDNRTAEGFFSAEGIYDSQNWLYTDDYGHTSPARGVYGPKFIRVDVPGTRAIGIHGTSSPGSIGHRTSHGCIRLVNDNILDLVKYAQVGMPIIISPGPRDMAVNAQEGSPIPSVTTEPGGTRAVAGKNVMDPNAKVDNKTTNKSGQNATNKQTEPAKEQTESTEQKQTSPESVPTKETTPSSLPENAKPEPAPKPEPVPASAPAPTE